MKYLPYIIIAVILSSCVYYNTFYNAEQYFASAQQDGLTQKGTPTRNAIQNYNKAMKKCGVILTDYKDSKWADDALFMMSQCLFYKQKYVQAKEKFQEVIQFYPDTDFAERANIYLARCEYRMGREEKAYQLLRDYIVTSTSRHYLVEATNLLAEYYLENEEFTQAEHYYQKVIDNYPKSDLYQDAFFSLGLLYHRNEEYENSNQVFTDFLKVKTEKKRKLDARYYLLLNLLLNGEYTAVLEDLPSLIKNEYREDEIAKLQLLKARALAQTGDTDKADIIFEQIITDNDKTPIAAESSYWRAEMHFRLLNNYEAAIEYYNNVRSQNSSSPYVDKAVSHSAVASQIVQYNSSGADIEIRQLITEQMKLAEYYLEVLELPDSAMVVYDNIISNRDSLVIKVDSLQFELDNWQERSALDSLVTAEEDSMATVYEEQGALVDTLLTSEDSLAVTPDSLDIEEQGLEIVLQDTTEIVDKKIVPPKETTRADTILERIEQFQSEIELYDIEFIPYVNYVKLWIIKNVYQDSALSQSFYQDFSSAYPDNKYSYAASQLMQDKEVEFISFEQKKQRSMLDSARDIIFTDPDSAAIVFSQISQDSLSAYYKEAVYLMGYMQYHIYQDTTAAKPYFDEILTWNGEIEYHASISNLYKDGKFLRLERLPALVDLEEREAEEEARLKEEAMQDSTAEDDELTIELEEVKKNAPPAAPGTAAPRSPRPKNP